MSQKKKHQRKKNDREEKFKKKKKGNKFYNENRIDQRTNMATIHQTNQLAPQSKLILENK